MRQNQSWAQYFSFLVKMTAIVEEESTQLKLLWF